MYGLVSYRGRGWGGWDSSCFTVKRSLPGLENVSDRKALTTVALVQKHVVPLPTGLVSKSEITYRQRPFQIYALAGIIAVLEKLLFLPLFSAFLF